LSLKYCLLAVEGPHDQAAITKVLQLSGLEKFDGSAKALDPFWEGFVPRYPKGGNLYTRMDMPSIVTSQTHSVAVYWGEGSRLVQNLIAIATNHKRYAEDIQAFGLITDADRPPHVIARKKAKEMRTIFPGISESPGIITDGPPRTGIYVLPDNKRKGILDSILVECASIIYPDHKCGAEKFLKELDNMHTSHLQNSAMEKALVSCIVSVLRPSASNTSSIAQDNWICEETSSKVTNIILLDRFLRSLLQLSS
jgi:Protein of unknown function (DUF3226)